MQTDKEYIAGRGINSLRCESVGEYSLPDYNGDVKKILAVKTKVFPSGKFVGDNMLEFSGTVGYEVVYIDAENNVTHAEFSTDYDAAVKVNSDSYVDSDIKTAVSSYNMRLIGPRKFSVKCLLDNEVCISEKRSYSVEGDAFGEYEPEVLTQSVSVYSPVFASGEIKEISGEILSLDGAIADEVEILVCDVHADVNSVEFSDGLAQIKGDINVSLLYRNEDAVPVVAEKSVPYSEEVISDIGEYDAESDARIEVVAVKASVTPTEDGVTLGVTASVAPKLHVKKNCSFDVITDAYLKERGAENEYSEFGYTEHICTAESEEKFDTKYTDPDSDAENIGDVIYSEAIARYESCEIEDEAVKIIGEIKFSAIACQLSEDGEKIYTPVKFTVPFCQNVNVGCQIHDNMSANCSVTALDTKIENDDGTLLASCTLLSSVNLTSDRRQRCIGASYITNEEYSREESVVTVYYPDSSESLFDIAKKFHTSVSAIAESNKLSESVFASVRSPVSVSGVKKLMIN